MRRVIGAYARTGRWRSARIAATGRAVMRRAPLLLLILAACATGKREATSLVTAVDAYRHAAGTVKERRGRDVSAVACSDDRVCAAKQACVAAIEPTVRALALKDEVAARVADIEKGTLPAGSPEARALPSKLDEAEELLREGREKMGACDARLADLHVDFGV